MISNKTSMSFPKKLIKNLNDLLLPFAYAAALLFGLFSLFDSKEGTNASQTYRLIFLVLLAAIVALRLLHSTFKRRDPRYQAYQAKLSRVLDLSNVIPLLALTVVVLFPFYLLVITSFKNTFEAISIEFSWWPQEGIDLKSFETLMNYKKDGYMDVSILGALGNSFVYAIIPTSVGLFSSSLAAYAFSKLQFKGKGAMYSVLIATMMMPGCVTLSTSYLLYSWYGWVNSPLPLIVPGLFGSASCVMFLREFMMGIPNGLLEAAEIDGAGKWKRYLYIMLPLAKPALTAQFILSFISAFNDYLGPLIYLRDEEGYPIQIFMNALNDSVFDLSIIASACVCALLPMLIIYIIFQKVILNGISISSGLKG